MAKIVNIHKNFIKKSRNDDSFLDLLAISVFLKLKFSSSALKAKSTRAICDKLHIGLDKFKRLKSSDLYDDMFNQVGTVFIGRTLRRRGKQIQFSYNDSIVSIFVGKKKIYNKRQELKSYKEVKKLIRKVIVFINVLEQERVTHSGMRHTGNKVSTDSTPKSGSLPIFVGCSNRRMADKSGMSATSVKKIVKECVNDGMFWKVTRRTVALSTRGMSDEDAVKAVDDFFKGLEREEGTFYYRSKSGRTVYQQRSNIYGTFLGLEDMKFKKINKSSVSPAFSKPERIEIYDPDICNGLISEDKTILSDGEIINRPRVPLNRIEKAINGEGRKLSKSERRRLRKYYAIKNSMTKEQIENAAKWINDAMHKTWISPTKVVNTAIKIVKQVEEYQRGYNRTCKSLGLPIATFRDAYDFIMNYFLLQNKDKLDIINLIGFSGIQYVYLQILSLPKGSILGKNTIGQSLPGASYLKDKNRAS